VTNDYTHYSSKTYLPLHKDVTITVDTLEIELMTDWTYNIYLCSVDDITCPNCDGSGGASVLTTCNNCKGMGTLTITETCSNCQGTGQVTTQTSRTCSACGGSGYVTNWTNVSLVAVVILVVFGGTLAFVFLRKRQPQ
jgi:RecJ-like exonuclease